MFANAPCVESAGPDNGVSSHVVRPVVTNTYRFVHLSFTQRSGDESRGLRALWWWP